MNVGNLVPPCLRVSAVSVSGVKKQGQGDSCQTPIPFGWKVIPQTAEATSDAHWVNLERLNIHFAKMYL